LRCRSERLSDDSSSRTTTRTFAFEGSEPFVWGFCQAATTEDDRAFCTTQDPQLVEAMRAIDSTSWVSFRWNENGECTYAGASTQSFYLDLTKDQEKNK